MESAVRLLAACCGLALLGAAAPASAGAVLVFADGFESPCVLGSAECPGFAVDTPELLAAPGELTSYCYYFHTPPGPGFAVQRFEAELGGATAYMVLFATYDNAGTPAEQQPSGTLTPNGCAFEANIGGVSSRRVWAAHKPQQSLQMPTDDGDGTPVAFELLGDQPMFIEIVVANAGVDPQPATVQLRAHALPPGDAYTRTETYMTYDGQFSLPPSSTGVTVSGSCAAPAGALFWSFTTHTHGRAVEATLTDTGQLLVSTSDWEDPAITTFGVPFHGFGAGDTLDYECVYNNSSGASVFAGADHQNEENCVGVGYFFPAEGPLLCVDGFGPF